MNSLFLIVFVLVLVPAAAIWFGADSREASDPRSTQRSLVS
jgi:hypothetical protein